MTCLVEQVGRPRSNFPTLDHSCMMSLDEYWSLARRCIKAFAPNPLKSHMLRNDDAISFTAYYIMKGDWQYNNKRGSSIPSFRGFMSKKAIQKYRRILNKQSRSPISIEQTIAGDGLTLAKTLMIPVRIIDDSPEEIAKERYVSNLVGSLKPQEKLCIQMHYYRDMRVVDIANELGLDRRSVERHLKKGLYNLKRLAGVIHE